MKRRILLIGTAMVLLVLAAGAGGLYAYDSSKSDVLARGITIGGIDVGGMSADHARRVLQRRLGPNVGRDVVVFWRHRYWRLQARDIHAHLNTERMVNEALRRSRDGSFVDRAVRELRGDKVKARFPIRVAYAPTELHAFADAVAKQVNQPAVNAAIHPSGVSLDVTPSKKGLAVQKRWLALRVLRQFRNPYSRHYATVPTRVLRPHLSTARLAYKYPTFLTIDRAGYTLRLWKHLQLVRSYTIAVGRQGLETPAGLYEINDRQINPSWHVPTSAWAGSLAGQVIPPGPDDPLKARWLGFYNGAGIHGTDDIGSLGTSASHGCIRMSVPDVEELYPQVPLHTPIYVG